MMFQGFRIIESRYLIEPGEPVEVRRTWRERLFTRPWHPWKATRIEIPQIPSRSYYITGEGSIIIHPERLKQLTMIDPARFMKNGNNDSNPTQKLSHSVDSLYTAEDNA